MENEWESFAAAIANTVAPYSDTVSIDVYENQNFKCLAGREGGQCEHSILSVTSEQIVFHVCTKFKLSVRHRLVPWQAGYTT